MTMTRMQDEVRRFVQAHGLEIGIADRLLDVVSELGEVAKEALRATRYGTRCFEKGENWEDELGDVLFSIICMANSSGVNLESALRHSLRKYSERVCAHGTPDSTVEGANHKCMERNSRNG